MAEINLLKQTSPSQNFAKQIPSLLVKFFAVVGLAVVGFYVWLNVQNKLLEKNLVKLSAEIVESKKSALTMEKREELLTKQHQLKEYAKLIAGQTFFSQIFEPLAAQAYKNSKYLTMRATSDGSVSMKVNTPTLQDLDKMFQMFNTEDFMKNFNNVKVGGFYKSKNTEGVDEYLFEIKMNYNTEIIKAKTK